MWMQVSAAGGAQQESRMRVLLIIDACVNDTTSLEYGACQSANMTEKEGWWPFPQCSSAVTARRYISPITCGVAAFKAVACRRGRHLVGRARVWIVHPRGAGPR